jgi:hypothetical protein
MRAHRHPSSNRGGARDLALRALYRRPCTKTIHASRVRSLLYESRYQAPFPVRIPGIEIAPGSGFDRVDRPRPQHCSKALCGSAAVGAFPTSHDRGRATSLATRALYRRPCTKTIHASRVRSLLYESRYQAPFPVRIPGIEIAPGSGFDRVDRPRPQHCSKALCGSVAVGAFPTFHDRGRATSFEGCDG